MDTSRWRTFFDRFVWRVIALIVTLTVATLVALFVIVVISDVKDSHNAIVAANSAIKGRDASSARFSLKVNSLEAQLDHLLRNSARAQHQRDVLNEEVKTLTRRLARDHAQTIHRTR